MKEISNKFSSAIKKGRKYLKDKKNTLMLYGTLVVAGAGMLASSPVYGQNAFNNYANKTKSEQVDTLWGANNSTPDSVVNDLYSSANIRQTYGEATNNPNLDWNGMNATEKASYFKEAMDGFIALYKNYNTTDANGKTVLTVPGAICTNYSDWADYVLRGENNIGKDSNSSLNWSTDIKDTTVKYNGYFNVPVLEIGGTASGGIAHSISGVYLPHYITDTTSLNSFALRDSRTNYSAQEGSQFLQETGTVRVLRNGYYNGNFTQDLVMKFKFHSDGTSYLIYVNPEFYNTDPKDVAIQNKAPNDTTINYSDAWKSYLKKFDVSVNQDTTRTLNTNDGSPVFEETVSEKNSLEKKVVYSTPVPTKSGAASKYNFKQKVTSIVEYVQNAVQKDIMHPDGVTYKETLKSDTSSYYVTVQDTTAPKVYWAKTDTTVDNASDAEPAAKALLRGSDNSGDFTLSDTLVYNSDTLQTYMGYGKDVSNNTGSTSNKLKVHISSTTGVFEYKVNTDKYGIQKVWPNPYIQSGGNNLFFDYKAKTNGPIEVDFFDLSGRRVMTYIKQTVAGINRIEISVPNINPGTYLLDCGGQCVKVVVQ